MLSGIRSTSLDLARPLLICCFALLLFVYDVNAQDESVLDVPLTSPSLVYTPFVCNTSEVLLNPGACTGAWQISDDGEWIAAATPSNNIVPQMFFQFQASKLFLGASSASNATINITLSSNGVSITSMFNSSLGTAELVNLPQNQVTLLTLSTNPSPELARFELVAISLTASASGTPLLPAPTIPASAGLPSTSTSLTSLASATPAPKESHPSRKMVAQAVGLTVGLGLGLTFVALLAFFWWRRRRRRKDSAEVSVVEAKSGWRGTPV